MARHNKEKKRKKRKVLRSHGGSPASKHQQAGPASTPASASQAMPQSSSASSTSVSVPGHSLGWLQSPNNGFHQASLDIFDDRSLGPGSHVWQAQYGLDTVASQVGSALSFSDSERMAQVLCERQQKEISSTHAAPCPRPPGYDSKSPAFLVAQDRLGGPASSTAAYPQTIDPRDWYSQEGGGK